MRQTIHKSAINRQTEGSKCQYLPGIGQWDHVVDINVAGLCPGLAIVGRIPRSAGGGAGVVLLDVGAIAAQEGLTGCATVLLSCLYSVWIFVGDSFLPIPSDPVRK